MSRLPSISHETAEGKTKALLDGVQANFGIVPNIFKGMANSPAVLDGMLKFMGALGGGVLSEKMKEQIALCVGEANGCEYCLSAHTVMGQNAGLSEEEIYLNRRGESVDNKVQVALSFVRKVVEKRGWVSDEELEAVRGVGYSDEEITEVIANIAIHNFTNYFNHIAETEVDFPVVPKLDSN
jgi:uncharacterized peroxidase-related enzyme